MKTSSSILAFMILPVALFSQAVHKSGEGPEVLQSESYNASGGEVEVRYREEKAALRVSLQVVRDESAGRTRLERRDLAGDWYIENRDRIKAQNSRFIQLQRARQDGMTEGYIQSIQDNERSEDMTAGSDPRLEMPVDDDSVTSEANRLKRERLELSISLKGASTETRRKAFGRFYVENKDAIQAENQRYLGVIAGQQNLLLIPAYLTEKLQKIDDEILKAQSRGSSPNGFLLLSLKLEREILQGRQNGQAHASELGSMTESEFFQRLDAVNRAYLQSQELFLARETPSSE